MHLKAALLQLLASEPPRPLNDSSLPFELRYADGTGFISCSRQWLDDLEASTSDIFVDWQLISDGKSRQDRTYSGSKPVRSHHGLRNGEQPKSLAHS